MITDIQGINIKLNEKFQKEYRSFALRLGLMSI